MLLTHTLNLDLSSRNRNSKAKWTDVDRATLSPPLPPAGRRQTALGSDLVSLARRLCSFRRGPLVFTAQPCGVSRGVPGAAAASAHGDPVTSAAVGPPPGPAGEIEACGSSRGTSAGVESPLSHNARSAAAEVDAGPCSDGLSSSWVVLLLSREDGELAPVRHRLRTLVSRLHFL